MAGNDWNLQNPTRTADNLNSSIHAIDGPSSQVAGIERVFPATAREDSGYRNAARMFLAKSARNLTQERNPCINRKSVDINPMLLPTVSRYLDACVARGNERIPITAIRLGEALRLWCLQLLDVFNLSQYMNHLCSQALPTPLPTQPEDLHQLHT